MDYTVWTKRLTKLITVFGIIAFIALLFCIWTLFFVSALILILAVILLSVFRKRMPEDKHKQSPPVIIEETEISIDQQVTERLKTEYPNARWVWAQPDTKQRIEKGEDVFVILNSAGGYRRAKISITDGKVEDITISLPKVRSTTENKTQTDAAEPAEQPVRDNYELVAFEWVEAHILELNEHINEAIGEGKTEYLIGSEELPVPESWESVRKELHNAGLSDVECVENGIKIKFTEQ